MIVLVFGLPHCSSEDPTQNPVDSTTSADSSSTAGGTTGTSGTNTNGTPTTTTSPGTNTTSPATSSVGGNGSTVSTSAGGSSSTVSATTSMGGSSTTGDSTISGGGAGGSSTTMGAGGTGAMGGEFVLTSSELEDGAAFLDKHTCAGSGFDNDESPPFSWSGAPQGTQSFALVFLDVTLTDMNDMNGYHWVMWDIPASVSSLPGNLPTGAEITDPVSAKQYNPLSASYLGPCPNIGGGSETHTYEFTLYAMPDAETASLAGLNSVQQLEAAIQQIALGSAVLSGTSDASP